MGFESKPPRTPEGSVDDYRDNPELYTLLKRLPAELQATHLLRLEDTGMDDTEATEYLRTIIERRESALREGKVSDPELRPYFEAHKEEIWQALETDVFFDLNNIRGVGQTARVKDYTLVDEAREKEFRMAVKYLITPTEMTLSASGEHDLVREVERIQLIEQAEAEHLDETLHFRVPHPYFDYKHGKLQCYGMELVDGTDLERYMEGETSEDIITDLRASLAGIDREALLREIDVFFDAMHEVCIHGDIKLKNIMVNREGRFYIIDFGQSRLMTDFGEKERESIDTKKGDEKMGAKTLITQFLNKLESGI